jgi:hypothetical protein
MTPDVEQFEFDLYIKYVNGRGYERKPNSTAKTEFELFDIYCFERESSISGLVYKY